MQHTTPWICKGIPQELREDCILLPCCQFPPGKAASHCGTVSALSLPCGLCSCCSWRRQRLLCCLPQHTHKLVHSLIVVFLSDGLCCVPLVYCQENVALFDSMLKCKARHWSCFPAVNWFSLCPHVFVVLWCRARRKRTYLAPAVIILPLLNGNAFGRVFSIQLAWFVVLFWRLNVVYNQTLLQ